MAAPIGIRLIEDLRLAGQKFSTHLEEKRQKPNEYALIVSIF